MINKFSFSFTLLIILLPITLITGPAIPDISITLVSLFFIYILYINNDYKIYLKKNIFIISFIFWFYLLFTSVFAENKYLSFRDSIIFIRILLIPLFLIYFVDKDYRILNKILFLIFLSIVFVTLDTFYQFTQYNSEFGFGKDILGFKSNWYGRLTGPFGKELIPGAYLSRFSFLGLAYLIIKFDMNKYKNLIIIVYLSIIGMVIFSTGERMALATFILGLFFLFVFFKEKRILFLNSIIISSLLIFFTYKIHPSYNDYKIIESTPYHLGLKVEKSYKCKNSNNVECKKIIELQPSFKEVIKNFNKSAYGEIYQLSIKMFLDNKLLGVGLNNFTFLCNNHERYKNLMKRYVCVSHPHNIYIQWIVETGLIGFSLFLLYLIYIFYFILIKNLSRFSILASTPILVMFWPIM